MQEFQSRQRRSFEVRRDQPLIGVIMQEDGESVVRYTLDDEDTGFAAEDSVRRALNLAGAWKDLESWDDVEAELDRIRHESRPTPGIDV